MGGGDIPVVISVNTYRPSVPVRGGRPFFVRCRTSRQWQLGATIVLPPLPGLGRLSLRTGTPGSRRFRMKRRTHRPRFLFATNFSWWLRSLGQNCQPASAGLFNSSRSPAKAGSSNTVLGCRPPTKVGGKQGANGEIAISSCEIFSRLGLPSFVPAGLQCPEPGRPLGAEADGYSTAAARRRTDLSHHLWQCFCTGSTRRAYHGKWPIPSFVAIADR